MPQILEPVKANQNSDSQAEEDSDYEKGCDVHLVARELLMRRSRTRISNGRHLHSPANPLHRSSLTNLSKQLLTTCQARLEQLP